MIYVNKYYSINNIKIFTEAFAFSAIYAGLAGIQLFFYLLKYESSKKSVGFAFHKLLIYLAIISLSVLTFTHKIDYLHFVITIIELLTLEISRIYMVLKKPNNSNSIFIIPPLIYFLSLGCDKFLGLDMTAFVPVLAIFAFPLFLFYLKLNTSQLSLIRSNTFDNLLQIGKVVLPMVVLQVSNLYFLQFTKFVVLKEFDETIFIGFANTFSVFGVVNTFLFALFVVKQPHELAVSKKLRKMLSLRLVLFHILLSVGAVMGMRVLSVYFGFIVLYVPIQLAFLALINLFMLLPQVLTFYFVERGLQSWLMCSVVPGLLAMLLMKNIIKELSVEIFLLYFLLAVVTNYLLRLILLRYNAS